VNWRPIVFKALHTNPSSILGATNHSKDILSTRTINLKKEQQPNWAAFFNE